jgi:hypothetical protein
MRSFSFAIRHSLFAILAVAAAPLARSAQPEPFTLNASTHRPVNSALDLSTTTVTFSDAQIPQAKVSGLTTALSSEASARAAADTSEASTRAAAVTAEASTRAAADAAHDTAIAAKANDNATVHNTGNETIAGTKTFSSAPIVPSASFAESAVQNLVSDLAAKANDSAAVHNTGNETIAGVKTFSSAPAVPDNSFAESKVTGLLTDLAAKAADSATVHNTGNETIAGTKTFSSAPAVPDNSFAESKVASLVSDLAAINSAIALKAADSATVHNTGTETIAGAKSFTGPGSFYSLTSNSVASTVLATPGSPTVTPIGAPGATTWSYKIVAKLSDGSTTAASSAGTTTGGDDTLDATNKNSLSWTTVIGAASYDVYRTAHGFAPSTLGKIANVTTNSYVDSGAAGDGSTAPALNNTGRVVGALLDKGGAVVNVKAYGAVGDDSVSDSAAIQAAIADAQGKSISVVFVPDGIYRLSTSITVPLGITIQGSGFSHNIGLPTGGTWFHHPSAMNAAGSNAPAFIVPSLRVVLKDFGIYQDQPLSTPGWTPTVYPPAIKCVGSFDSLLVENLMLLNVYDGIVQDSLGLTVPVGQIDIRRLFGQPLHRGISLEFVADVCRFDGIHFWRFWHYDDPIRTYLRANAIGIDLQRTDNPLFSNIFCFGYNAMFRFGQNGWGGTALFNGTNIMIDDSVHVAIITQDSMVTSQWTNVDGFADPGGAMFDVQGAHNSLSISNVRTLGGQFLHAGGTGDHKILVTNAYFDALPVGSTEKLIQSDSLSNVVTISNFYSLVPSSAFSGGPGFVGTIGGNVSPPWIAPTLLNGWTNIGDPFAPAGYKKDGNNIVKLRGLIVGGSTTAGLTGKLWLLPDGFRPTKDLVFFVPSGAGGIGSIFIDAASGYIQLNVNAPFANLCLDNISFSTDQ